jgi:hypothetical protein
LFVLSLNSYDTPFGCSQPPEFSHLRSTQYWPEVYCRGGFLPKYYTCLVKICNFDTEKNYNLMLTVGMKVDLKKWAFWSVGPFENQTQTFPKI